MTIKGRFGEVEKMVEGLKAQENLRNWKNNELFDAYCF
jgi:hypothetical protein